MIYDAESATSSLGAAPAGFGSESLVCGRSDAALMDGSIAPPARPRRDAGWAHPHVHDTPGILHLRHAWSIVVDSGIGRGQVPTALDIQRHLVSAGRAGLPDN